MIRTIDFEEKAKCDVCGKRGAYDLMGDYYCEECLAQGIEVEKEYKLPHADRRDARRKNKVNK